MRQLQLGILLEYCKARCSKSVEWKIQQITKKKFLKFGMLAFCTHAVAPYTSLAGALAGSMVSLPPATWRLCWVWFGDIALSFGSFWWYFLLAD